MSSQNPNANLFCLNEDTNEKISMRQAFEGIFVFGGTGSGKSSGSGRTIAMALLKANLGGVVLTVKDDECAEWIKYAIEAKRESDIVVIGPKTNNPLDKKEYHKTVDLVAFEYLQYGKSPGFNAQLTDILWDSSSDNELANKGSDSFWIEAPKLMLRHAISIAKHYASKNKPLTLLDIMSVIKEAPVNLEPVKSDDSPGSLELIQDLNSLRNDYSFYTDEEEKHRDFDFKKWMEDNTDEQAEDYDEWLDFMSRCYKVNRDWLNKMLALFLYEDAYYTEKLKYIDVRAALHYWLAEYPMMPKETKNSVHMIIQSRLDYLTMSPFIEHFFSKNTINIRNSLGIDDNGQSLPLPHPPSKIFILNVPQKTYHNTGVTAQTLFKQVWQRAAERRGAIGHPAFLWIDEAQFFITKDDSGFLQTARSSRIVTVFLTQTIPNIRRKLDSGESTNESETLLSNFQTIIFHANSCPITNEYAEKLFGVDWVTMSNVTTTTSGAKSASGTASQNITRQKMPLYEAQFFTTLKSGGELNDRKVEALVFRRAYRDGKPVRTINRGTNDLYNILPKGSNDIYAVFVQSSNDNNKSPKDDNKSPKDENHSN